MAEQPERLNTPGRQRTWLPKVKFSEDAFGAFAEHGFAQPTMFTVTASNGAARD